MKCSFRLLWLMHCNFSCCSGLQIIECGNLISIQAKMAMARLTYWEAV